MTDSPLVQPVSARSAVLSLLLGADPPTLGARDIVGAMSIIGVSESTTRVALSRMVSSGDLVRDGAGYTLSRRLVDRQTAVRTPSRLDWSGAWEMAVVTVSGRSATDRAALRRDMIRLRLAELREGVWMRPANLHRDWPYHLREVSARFEVFPEESAAELVGTLWDLDSWAQRAGEYAAALDTVTDEPTRFVTMVGAVRHLQTDPLLPAQLLPVGWPGDELGATYEEYRAWLAGMRDNAHAGRTRETVRASAYRR